MADGGVLGILPIFTASLGSLSLLAIGASALASLLAFILHQLYLHPLAKYPGPLLGRLTRWYDVYHAYIGDKHLLLYHLHRKHGHVVRFTPNTLSINSPAALKAIYAHGANVQKAEFYKCFRAAPHAVSGFLATDRNQHARKRRVMAQAFSEQAMKGLEEYVLLHAQDLMDRIGVAVKRPGGEKGRWSHPLDMQRWCNWLVFDIMGDLVFGKSFGTLGEAPENREGIRLLGRAARRNYTVAAMPALLYTGVERWLPPFRRLYLDRNQYLAFGKRQVLARTQETGGFGAETGRRDIFSYLLHAKDPESGEGFPMPELWMEGNTLIVAGSDTSSTTLAAVLFYLLTNPSALTLLASEIRRTFPTRSSIRTGPAMSSCHWLRACIDETMRLSPAVPGLLPREVLRGGLSIPDLDLHLPEGVNVGVCTYAIQHHETYVPNPFLFDPGRWLRSDAGSGEREALQSVFNPFSQGHRACLGKPLVYMELSIAVARLVWEYEMRLAGEQFVGREMARDVRQGKRHAGEYHLKDWFMSGNFGPWVEFRGRDFEAEERADSAVADLE